MKSFYKTLRKKRRKDPLVIWYWGIHKEWGRVFGFFRSDLTPHLRISPPRRPAFVGYDEERHRFAIRPAEDPGIRRLGWRKRFYQHDK